MRSLLCFLLVLGLQCNGAFSYKILLTFTLPSPSHQIIGRGLMKGLIADGHEVTMISLFKEKDSFENFTEIHLDGLVEQMASAQQQQDSSFVALNNLNYWAMLRKMTDMGIFFGNMTLSHPRFQQFLQSDAKYDVIVINIAISEALLGLGHHFQAPVIALSPQGALKSINDLVGTPNIPSYVPNTFLGYSDKMTFLERAETLFYSYLEDIYIAIFYMPRQQQLLDTHFPDKDMPSLDELRRKVSLALLNTHVTLGSPRPYAPNMIEVGGLNIDRNGKPLPENLQHFLDEAKNGAILFSLGSNVRFSQLSSDFQQAVLNAFRICPKMRILFKLDGNVTVPTHAPNDVLIQSWLPQESVLAHPNVKLFVTHGGLLSTTESVYFGKPVVGIPIFADQKINMKLATLNGIGEYVPFEEFSQEKFEQALRKVLSDARYDDKVKIVSDRYRDQIATPLETAIHWVKHVAKNKGAPHLHSAAVDIPYYVYYNLDVYFALFLMVYSLLSISKIVGRKIIESIKGNNSSKTKRKTN